MAPAPIPKNKAPTIGEKMNPPNQVPKMAGAPAIIPRNKKSFILGLVFKMEQRSQYLL